MLLNKSKCAAGKNNFKYAWLRNSNIFARKADNSPIIFINSDNDLAKLK